MPLNRVEQLPSEKELASVIAAHMKTRPYWNGDVYDFSDSVKAVLLLINGAVRGALRKPVSKRDELESLEKLSAEIDTRMQALRSEIELADV